MFLTGGHLKASKVFAKFYAGIVSIFLQFAQIL